ncbi:2-oxoglutarate malate translocase [Blastocystis sp. subtype 4]|uniref:2-oxoglutarate malate translocase n=1 Tax=Blastocystis sp. subtype 4 TaxID=944170 RepID=UPI000711D8E5|nr:2-oxoglutarate malate translocase [Blastocystis sp. subtype 4]KNB43498.1 2-oxoglutarate malate translocase [Blastocystis sp. subtype 4]|eukprot:XP_014526941.1 2-oxoglutarate malate translocase [Blastocystis sp. subtype 4]
MVKTRILLSTKNSNVPSTFTTVVKYIWKNAGIKGFYQGLSAAFMREAVYGTARLGIFDSLSAELKRSQKVEVIPLWQKACCGLVAGALGGIMGNPFDIALVRMQADGVAPPELKRGYHNAFQAVYKIAREEGIRCLWRGAVPVVWRAIGMNTGLLASYDQGKEFLMRRFPDHHYLCSFGASGISGFICSFTALPFDLIKVRMMNMRVDPKTGQFPYRGFIDCIMKIYREEGFMRFWKGYWAFYSRSAPHGMITLMTKEFFTAGYNRIFRYNKNPELIVCNYY